MLARRLEQRRAHLVRILDEDGFGGRLVVAVVGRSVLRVRRQCGGRNRVRLVDRDVVAVELRGAVGILGRVLELRIRPPAEDVLAGALEVVALPGPLVVVPPVRPVTRVHRHRPQESSWP